MAETQKKISPAKLLISSVVLAVVASVALRLVKNEDPSRLFTIDSAAGYIALAAVTTFVAFACAYLGARYVHPMIGMLLGGVGGGFTTAVFITAVPGMFWGLFIGAIVLTRQRLWRITKWSARSVWRYWYWALVCVVAFLLGTGARYISIDTRNTFHLLSLLLMSITALVPLGLAFIGLKRRRGAGNSARGWRILQMALALLVSIPFCALFFLSGWQGELIRRIVMLDPDRVEIEWNLDWDDATLTAWLTRIWNGPVAGMACHYPDDDAWDLIHVLPSEMTLQVLTEPEYLAKVLQIVDQRQPEFLTVNARLMDRDACAGIWEDLGGSGNLTLLRLSLTGANATALYSRKYDSLFVDGYPDTAAVVEQLKYPELLWYVTLGGKHVGDKELAVLSRRIMEKPNPRFGSLSALQSMRLNQTQVTDSGIKHLHSIPSLVSLNIENGHMTGDGFAGWTTLTTLRIHDTPLTPAGIRAICSLPQLTHLTLDCRQIGSEGFDALQNATALTDLELSDPSDEIVKQLASTKIIDLTLTGDTYSLEAVKSVLQLKTLARLEVAGQQFQFEQLRAAVPAHVDVIPGYWPQQY